MNNDYKTKEFLEELYINQRFSTRQIAKRIGCSQPTVLKYLNRNNIPIRPYTENKSWVPKGGSLPEEVKKKISNTLMGHKLSEHTIQALKNANYNNKYRLGKKHTQETKDLIHKRLKGRFGGEKSPSWKGGITSKNRLERLRFRREM